MKVELSPHLLTVGPFLHLEGAIQRLGGQERSKKTKIAKVATLTRGGRQKGSSPLASSSSCSKATDLFGKWTPYDGVFKCVHRESEEAVWSLDCSLVEPVQLLLLKLDGHIKTWTGPTKIL